jgi:RNA polymerase sigma-70 factor (ECF subfamily)
MIRAVINQDLKLELDAGASLTDEEVAARVQAGEPALFELLMRRYNQRLYRVARAILRDDAEAEDVMQQAYVNAYAHLQQFSGRSKLATWLTRMAVHEALARLRRRARAGIGHSTEPELSADLALASPHPDPERQAFAGELRTLLEEEIDALPDAYRMVFVLREVEGLTTLETAEGLDLGEEAVKTRLHRARAMLRDALYDRAGIEAPSSFSFHLSRCNRIVEAVFRRLIEHADQNSALDFPRS